MTISILNDLAEKYFHKKGYKTESEITMEGVSGMPRKFDLVIRKPKEQRVVKILNWNRTVGINIVINACLNILQHMVCTKHFALILVLDLLP